jgi:hypothetical protein
MHPRKSSRVCWFLLGQLLARNAGTKASVMRRWGGPHLRIACEPVAPTPAVMPAEAHALGQEEQPPWEAERAGSPRQSACANEPSTCGEALALLHPPTGWLPEEQDGAPQTQNEGRDGGLH